MSDTKIKMLEWTHPLFSATLITPASWTPEDVATNYLEDGGDASELVSVEVDMTQAEIDALPEFDG